MRKNAAGGATGVRPPRGQFLRRLQNHVRFKLTIVLRGIVVGIVVGRHRDEARLPSRFWRLLGKLHHLIISHDRRIQEATFQQVAIRQPQPGDVH